MVIGTGALGAVILYAVMSWLCGCLFQ